MIRTQLVKKEAPLTSSVLNHVVAYDAIRLFAVFSVIAVHVATPVVANYNSSGKTAWWAGNLYESLFRSGIPLFLMLTGVLLLPKANGLRFKK
ncbi:acyltransferase family protein [Pontibacter sp. MBLB2868]|uniref:acyltransferase family protein n=1 Tax=Pontibacter sp. MBLB2868 TaxID=3451555 RepID=UPI003F753D3C